MCYAIKKCRHKDALIESVPLHFPTDNSKQFSSSFPRVFLAEGGNQHIM